MWKYGRLMTVFLMLPLLILTWLPTNRVPMDGPSYAWGLPLLGMELSGKSIDLDWLVVALFTLLALTTLWFLMRGTARQFGWLGTVYFGLFFLSAILMVMDAEEPLVLHGDTLGVAIPLGGLIIGFTGLLLLIALAVLLLHWERDDRRPLTRGNRLFLGMALLAWCTSGIMLRLGDRESVLDQAGVLLLISVALFLPVALQRFGYDEEDPIKAYSVENAE